MIKLHHYPITPAKRYAVRASHSDRIAREMSQPCPVTASRTRRILRNRVFPTLVSQHPAGAIRELNPRSRCSDCFRPVAQPFQWRGLSEEAATPKYSATCHDTFLETFRQFTLENHRQPPAVPQFVAALSRHPRMRCAILCLNQQTHATENLQSTVQKLWRTKVLCGNERKTQEKTTESATGNEFRS